MNDLYLNQVDFLLEILPFVMRDRRFSLKGGTAINLFYQNMPRLSVDIDLCYVPIETRDMTFKNIHKILKLICSELQKRFEIKIIKTKNLNFKDEARLIINYKDFSIKIEPNYILRGTLFDSELKQLSLKAISKFSKNVEAQCVSFFDLYGGKICAALDRQHPRDLFDIKILLDTNDFTEKTKQAFFYYLMSSNRTILELLNPNLKDISQVFKTEFSGMTDILVSLTELENTRIKLIRLMNESLTESDKEFLISYKTGSPKWHLYEYDKIKDYPSIKWKLYNIQKISDEKKLSLIKNLENYFQENKIFAK